MSAKADDLTGYRILVVMPSIPVQGMERSVLQVMRMMIERNAHVMFVTNRAHGARVQRAVWAIGANVSTARADVQLLHLPRSPNELGQLLKGWARGAWDICGIARTYGPTH